MGRECRVFDRVCRALAQVVEPPRAIEGKHRLVDDLGLDSIKVASLTIALEDEFDDILLLNDWIAAARDPRELTVESLANYVRVLLGEMT